MWIFVWRYVGLEKFKRRKWVVGKFSHRIVCQNLNPLSLTKSINLILKDNLKVKILFFHYMYKIFIGGGSGYVGSYLIKTLLKKKDFELYATRNKNKIYGYTKKKCICL